MAGAGRFERPTPCAQVSGWSFCNTFRFNCLEKQMLWLVETNSYNFDYNAAQDFRRVPKRSATRSYLVDAAVHSSIGLAATARTGEQHESAL